jgi:hypothetical protein
MRSVRRGGQSSKIGIFQISLNYIQKLPDDQKTPSITCTKRPFLLT